MIISDITVHNCPLDARKLKLNTAYNCSVELTGKLNSLSFVINIFLSITCTAGNTPGTKTATLGFTFSDKCYPFHLQSLERLSSFHSNYRAFITYQWKSLTCYCDLLLAKARFQQSNFVARAQHADRTWILAACKLGWPIIFPSIYPMLSAMS